MKGSLREKERDLEEISDELKSKLKKQRSKYELEVTNLTTRLNQTEIDHL